MERYRPRDISVFSYLYIEEVNEGEFGVYGYYKDNNLLKKGQIDFIELFNSEKDASIAYPTAMTWNVMMKHLEEAGMPYKYAKKNFKKEPEEAALKLINVVSENTENKNLLVLPSSKSNYFVSFHEAKEWAKINLGKIIVRSSDGKGFISKNQLVDKY